MVHELAEKHRLSLVDNDVLVPREPRDFVECVHFTPEGMHLIAENISVPIIKWVAETRRQRYGAVGHRAAGSDLRLRR